MIIIGIFAIFSIYYNEKFPQKAAWKYLMLSVIGGLIGILAASFGIIAAITNKMAFLWVWFAIGLLLFPAEILLWKFSYSSVVQLEIGLLPGLYCGMRLLVVLGLIIVYGSCCGFEVSCKHCCCCSKKKLRSTTNKKGSLRPPGLAISRESDFFKPFRSTCGGKFIPERGHRILK